MFYVMLCYIIQFGYNFLQNNLQFAYCFHLLNILHLKILCVMLTILILSLALVVI